MTEVPFLEGMESFNTTPTRIVEEYVPWQYNINLEDSNWVITSSFMIFTMQTGFGMLESGCVSVKNEVNIMMKNVVDIVLGGFTYWLFGYALSFGRMDVGNGFLAFGDFCIDPDLDNTRKGAMYAAFIFQLSFATTATTIVSGAMAERCNFKAYCIFSFWNTLIYCVPAGWVWNENGFLKKMGVVDIAGSGPVHLIGGSAALASAIMLGPRLGRYDNGTEPLPLGNPVNAVMGLFVLWWGWLAFNSGSTYGLSGVQWEYAARAAVMTMMASFGGGMVTIAYSFMATPEGHIEVIHVINGVLGSLVSITAGCFLYTAWEAILVGVIGALLCCFAMPLFDKAGIDDPVGASAVHGVGGIWGVLAVGIFAQNPIPLSTTNGRSGLIRGGGFYLLGVQALACVCLVTWGMLSCMLLLWLINKVVLIRTEVHVELMGADLVEHHIKHGRVGVSRAVSVFRPLLDTSDVENIIGIGLNPGHDINVEVVKNSTIKRKYRLSKIMIDVTKNRNFGINAARKLFPHKKEEKNPCAGNKKGSKKSGKGVSLKNTKVVSTIDMVQGEDLPKFAWVD